MKLLREYIKELLKEQNVLAVGMCFPFAAKKAEEWFDDHFEARKGRAPKRHPDLNNMDKFKVVHGKVTDKWQDPPKPIVHAWVEMGDLVFDDQTKMTKPEGVSKDVYYEMYQPEVVEEYTAEEVVVNCIMKGEGPWNKELQDIMKARDSWMNETSESLTERDARKNKTKRILYHINKHRPARPQPKMSYLQQWDKDAIDPDTGERTGDLVDVPGTDNWDRWWLESPVKSGVFLTPNPVDIAMNHGRSGHVYAYKVPEWVIEKSGGLHRYDTGSEVLIPEDIWNKAGKEIEFLGKSMDHNELHAKIDKTQTHGRGSKRKPTKPSWLSDEELKAWEDRQKQFNITGLRATKHPADAIKILSQEEVKSAIAAIESEYSPKPDKTIPAAPGDRKGIKLPDFQKKVTKKDEELLALLKKRLNESAIRAYIREHLTEDLARRQALAKDLEDSESWPMKKGDRHRRSQFEPELALPAGRVLKKAFHKHADHSFMNSLTTVHWADNVTMIKNLLKGSSKDEISTSAYLPGELATTGTGAYGAYGIEVKGYISLLANNMDAINTGSARDFYDLFGVEHDAHRTASSGRNKGVKKTYIPGGYARDNAIVVLSKSDWNPYDSDDGITNNEALVDNWRPVAIVTSNEEYYSDGDMEELERLAKEYGLEIKGTKGMY